jgi:hypothetical protein
MTEAKRALDPKLAVTDEIAERLKKNSKDVATRMRIDLYVMDVVTVAATDQNSVLTDEQIIEVIKKGEGFRNLNTVLVIPDKTTTTLVKEAREKLYGKKTP